MRTTTFRFTYRHPRDHGVTGRLAVIAHNEAEAREKVQALADCLDVVITGLVPQGADDAV